MLLFSLKLVQGLQIHFLKFGLSMPIDIILIRVINIRIIVQTLEQGKLAQHYLLILLLAEADIV